MNENFTLATLGGLLSAVGIFWILGEIAPALIGFAIAFVFGAMFNYAVDGWIAAGKK